MNKNTHLKFLVVISILLVLTACGGGGGDSDTPTSLSNTGSTVIANYSKGPVTGATGLLKDTNGETVAGPVTTGNDGQATFENVTHIGPAYAVFNGGSYTDEATGTTVTLNSSFEMRSGVINNTGTGTLVVTTTPLTEIGFHRAVTQNSGNVNLDTVNNQIVKVADEYGLDNIDVITVVPAALKEVTGNSDEDRYGVALAAITQQQLNNSQTPNSASLRNYINNSVNNVDQSAFATAVLDLQTNAVTQSYINTTVINSITSHIGIHSHTLGGFISGLVESVMLQVNNVDNLPINANGVFTFSTALLVGTKYTVTVSIQPVGQTCSISNGSGTVGAADVTNIAVSCVTNPLPTYYSIGGTINGLTGTLVLQNNDGDTLTTTNNGNFNFATSALDNKAYSTRVSTQPAGQTCSISNGSGTVATADVSNIVVSCMTNVTFVDIASGGSPVGTTFWYIGDKKWERESSYDCEGFTEMGLGESLILLSNAAGTENIEINLEDMTITSDQHTLIDEVFDFGNVERPAESYVACPSTSNDHTPMITSATAVEVNGGRVWVLSLQASDADLPPEDLSFSLSNNPETDNALFGLSNFIENSRSACRAGTQNQGHPEDPNNVNYFIVEEGVNSLKECQDACNEHPLYAGSAFSCRGIEYRAEGANSEYPDPRCELWKTSIRGTVPQPGYGCYTRESESPNVLSFINAPDFRIPLDADVDNVYEVEAKVSDGIEGNSSTQTILVTVIPNGDYLGTLRTACRAGTQNEGHPEDPNNSYFFTIVNDVDSLEDCKALCDAYPLLSDLSTNCMGVEYRAEGADYADTQSRCELWKTPIVATTPQKEYSCYVRELVRDGYGPADQAYIGDYKAYYYDDNEDFAIKTMTLSLVSPSKLLWTEDGNSWEVDRTADRGKLQTGNDYPYKGDGYEEPAIFWHADEVAGIKGPDGRIYRSDWTHAKLSQSQAVYRRYINDHPGETIRVEEAERLIRELKWAIAEKINTAAAYRAYMIDIGDYYGRTQEAEIRIAGFKAFVTAEILQIEVDEDVPGLFGEDNDLELFYNLEFTKNWRYPADDTRWSTSDLILTSVRQVDGSKITNINDGADDAFMPAGNAEKTIEATENETLRYGGLMFEMDSTPEGFQSDAEIQGSIDDCNWYGPGDFETRTCAEIYADDWHRTLQHLFSNTPVDTPTGTINGIFSTHWNGHRTWAGNASSASDSLNYSYFTITMADLEYQIPTVRTESVKFESDEEIRIKYEITKRTEEQYQEYLDANATLSCDEPPVRNLTPRTSVSIDPPGFIVRNETDQHYSVSLNQVGPLYYGEVKPGAIFVRDTAWGHFTIDAVLNMTGEQRYDNWDVAAPIAQFTAEVLLTAVTGGNAITSLKSVINTTITKVATSTARSGATALGRTAFGRATMRVGAKALQQAATSNHQVLIKLATASGYVLKEQGIDLALNEAFTQDLVDHIYNEEATGEYITWSYSGGWPGNVGMYHIVGGPRLPCLNSDGDIEIRSSKLQILDDEECAASSICTLH